ncbi:50S ribosomal protein L15 [Candidatus Daviesbacteria bacterium]|nr:50S ribosomal protein L15 [Candidatus Daviesbacteria bacterium]
MKLHKLTKVTTRSKKRIGRGLGSGKGKTGGRGTKGQKARGRVAAGFIGGTLPIYKKIPFRRGLGNPKRSTKMVPMALSKLELFTTGSTVDLQGLIDKGLILEKQAKKFGVKIVGNGEISKKLTIALPTTASAKTAIEKAGGKVVSG